jgi:hypothetical protein
MPGTACESTHTVLCLRGGGGGAGIWRPWDKMGVDTHCDWNSCHHWAPPVMLHCAARC